MTPVMRRRAVTTSGGAKEMTQYESHSRDDKGVSFYALQWPMGLRNDLHMPQGSSSHEDYKHSVNK